MIGNGKGIVGSEGWEREGGREGKGAGGKGNGRERERGGVGWVLGICGISGMDWQASRLPLFLEQLVDVDVRLFLSFANRNFQSFVRVDFHGMVRPLRA